MQEIVSQGSSHPLLCYLRSLSFILGAIIRSFFNVSKQTFYFHSLGFGRYHRMAALEEALFDPTLFILQMTSSVQDKGREAGSLTTEVRSTQGPFGLPSHLGQSILYNTLMGSSILVFISLIESKLLSFLRPSRDCSAFLKVTSHTVPNTDYL